MSDSNKMFRQEALERLSSPERLDQTLKVVDPKAWLPLYTAGSLVAVGLLWSIFGRIPLNVSGQGVLIQPRRVVSLQSPSQGQIVELKVEPGSKVKKGDVLGVIAQPALEQQLAQEQSKLAELSALNADSSSLQSKQLSGQRASLIQQKANLQESLRRAEIERDLRDKSSASLAQNRRNLESSLNNFQGLVPELREKSLSSLAQNRASLESRIAQAKQLIPTLESRIASYRKLLDDQLITGDVLLNTEREYLNSLSQLSQLETQLKQLDVEETNTQGTYLQNLNQINEFQSQLKQLDVEEASIQRQYFQSLNQIDDLSNKIQEIDTQLARTDREDIESSFDRNSRIQEAKNRIAQIEREISEKSRVVSKYDGEVLQLSVVPGQLVSTGVGIGTIKAANSGSKLVGVTYFASSDGKKIEAGMQAQITPTIVKRERYGGILGKVTQVST
ncbi:MAG: biotin/lipoyl-binding protein, partial [Cyanobacteria bacterium J06600_6]